MGHAIAQVIAETRVNTAPDHTQHTSYVDECDTCFDAARAEVDKRKEFVRKLPEWDAHELAMEAMFRCTWDAYLFLLALADEQLRFVLENRRPADYNVGVS